MKNTSENKTIRFTIRMTKSQHGLLVKGAKHDGTNLSNYAVNCIKSANGASPASNHHVKPLSASEFHSLESVMAIIGSNLDKFRLDYTRAFNNLEHDNDLYNHGKLSNIPEKALRRAESACLNDKNKINDLEAEVNEIEATLYDS